MKKYFMPHEVTAITGLTYRQIQHMDSTGLARPAHLRRGKYRLYNLEDLTRITLIAFLRKNGLSIQRIRIRMTAVDEAIAAFGPIDAATFLFEVGTATFLIHEGKAHLHTGTPSLYGRHPKWVHFSVPDFLTEVEKRCTNPLIEALETATKEAAA